MKSIKVVRITKSSDPSLWYAPYVGKLAYYLGEYYEDYVSREKEGYKNIIRKEDGEVIEVVETSWIQNNLYGFSKK